MKSYFSLAIGLFLFFSAQEGVAADLSHCPPDVVAALDSAGQNQPELEKVLQHYSPLRDSLKFRAACFLIGNMEGHSYVTYALRDTLKNDIPFDVLQFKDYPTLEKAFDTLQKSHGTLDFSRKETVQDLSVIKADFLINHIDLAFRAWREKPWAKSLSFDQFCEYVLPYRGSNETLEEWRRTFWDKYKRIESKMTKKSDPIEAACIINKDVMTYFGFDSRYYYHPTDQGMSEMLAVGKGRCEDMTNITIYAMRANGIGVTSDFTPYWANTGNNHAWNAIVTGEGKVIPFMGAEANPGEYHLANKLAKAYRKTYAMQRQNLVFQPHKQEFIPAWLAGKNYTDVTADYVPVSDVTITLSKPASDSVDIAYLCVFNSGVWQPIQWGRISDSTVTFTGMGRGIAYLPAVCMNGEAVAIASPFILRDDGSREELQPINHVLASVQLTSTTVRKQEVSTDGVMKTYLTAGQEYELFYWQDGWKSLGKTVAGDKPLVFDKAPANCLFWLVAKDSDKEERIFTLNNGTQVWW